MSTFQQLRYQKRSAPALTPPTNTRSNQPSTLRHHPVLSLTSSGAPEGEKNAASSNQQDWQVMLDHTSRFGLSLARIPVGDQFGRADHSPVKEQFRQRILARRGQGHPLEESVQQVLEPRLGKDLSEVRVHTDADADHMARSVSAAAFTTGPDIFFRYGMYQPNSIEGLHLLAHEAVHTVQQAAGLVTGTPRAGGISISEPVDRFEQAAEADATRIVSESALQFDISKGQGEHMHSLHSHALTPISELHFKRDEYHLESQPDHEATTHELSHKIQQYTGLVQVQRHMYKGNWHGWQPGHKHQNEAEAKQAERNYDLSLKKSAVGGPSVSPKLEPKEGSTIPFETVPKVRGEKTRSKVKHITTPGQGAQPQQIEQGPVSAQQPAKLPTLNRETIQYILHFLTQEDLLTWRLVSKFYRKKAESILMRLFLAVKGYSPIEKSLLSVLISEIEHLIGTLRFAVDQLDPEQLEIILQAVLKKKPGLRKAIRINVGSNLLGSGKDYPEIMQTPGPKGMGKMHNKFLVGGMTVLTGSPNITYKGLHSNIEVLIKIVNPLVAGMFSQYFNLIRQGETSKTKQGEEFSKALASFNNIEASKLKLALAPFIKISKFIEAGLQGKDTIIVRMFLISLKEGEKEGKGGIIEALGKLADKGVDITVVIDEGNYLDKEQPFVRAAARYLVTKNVKIILQRTVQGDIMHDKLILAANKTAEGRFTNTRVMVGSSGFTTSVMRNRNYENFVSIDDDALFNYFYHHHRQSFQSKRIVSTSL